MKLLRRLARLARGKPRLDLYYARDWLDIRVERLREHGDKCASAIAIPMGSRNSWHLVVRGESAVERLKKLPIRADIVERTSGYPVLHFRLKYGRLGDTEQLLAALNDVGFTVYEKEARPW